MLICTGVKDKKIRAWPESIPSVLSTPDDVYELTNTTRKLDKQVSFFSNLMINVKNDNMIMLLCVPQNLNITKRLFCEL